MRDRISFRIQTHVLDEARKRYFRIGLKFGKYVERLLFCQTSLEQLHGVLSLGSECPMCGAPTPDDGCPLCALFMTFSTPVADATDRKCVDVQIQSRTIREIKIRHAETGITKNQQAERMHYCYEPLAALCEVLKAAPACPQCGGPVGAPALQCSLCTLFDDFTAPKWTWFRNLEGISDDDLYYGDGAAKPVSEILYPAAPSG